MNWTGGGLSRSRKSGKRSGSLIALQKEHFAKVRASQLHGSAKHTPAKPIEFNEDEFQSSATAHKSHTSTITGSQAVQPSPKNDISMMVVGAKRTITVDIKERMWPPNKARRLRLLKKRDWLGPLRGPLHPLKLEPATAIIQKYAFGGLSSHPNKKLVATPQRSTNSDFSLRSNQRSALTGQTPSNISSKDSDEYRSPSSRSIHGSDPTSKHEYHTIDAHKVVPGMDIYKSHEGSSLASDDAPEFIDDDIHENHSPDPQEEILDSKHTEISSEKTCQPLSYGFPDTNSNQTDSSIDSIKDGLHETSSRPGYILSNSVAASSSSKYDFKEMIPNNAGCKISSIHKFTKYGFHKWNSSTAGSNIIADPDFTKYGFMDTMQSSKISDYEQKMMATKSGVYEENSRNDALDFTIESFHNMEPRSFHPDTTAHEKVSVNKLDRSELSYTKFGFCKRTPQRSSLDNMDSSNESFYMTILDKLSNVRSNSTNDGFHEMVTCKDALRRVSPIYEEISIKSTRGFTKYGVGERKEEERLKFAHKSQQREIYMGAKSTLKAQTDITWATSRQDNRIISVERWPWDYSLPAAASLNMPPQVLPPSKKRPRSLETLVSEIYPYYHESSMVCHGSSSERQPTKRQKRHSFRPLRSQSPQTPTPLQVRASCTPLVQPLPRSGSDTKKLGDFLSKNRINGFGNWVEPVACEYVDEENGEEWEGVEESSIINEESI